MNMVQKESFDWLYIGGLFVIITCVTVLLLLVAYFPLIMIFFFSVFYLLSWQIADYKSRGSK